MACISAASCPPLTFSITVSTLGIAESSLASVSRRRDTFNGLAGAGDFVHDAAVNLGEI